MSNPWSYLVVISWCNCLSSLVIISSFPIGSANRFSSKTEVCFRPDTTFSRRFISWVLNSRYYFLERFTFWVLASFFCWAYWAWWKLLEGLRRPSPPDQSQSHAVGCWGSIRYLGAWVEDLWWLGCSGMKKMSQLRAETISWEGGVSPTSVSPPLTRNILWSTWTWAGLWCSSRTRMGECLCSTSNVRS